MTHMTMNDRGASDGAQEQADGSLVRIDGPSYEGLLACLDDFLLSGLVLCHGEEAYRCTDAKDGWVLFRAEEADGEVEGGDSGESRVRWRKVATGFDGPDSLMAMTPLENGATIRDAFSELCIFIEV